VIAKAAAAAGAFVLMEPVTCGLHRWVMHGPGWVLHRSHHEPSGRGGLEANDAFPVLFAGATVAAMAAGGGMAVAAGLGVTAYGAAYALVHDVVIHRRARAGGEPSGRLARLAAAHALHHDGGGAPYGMLWPVLPGQPWAKMRAATAAFCQRGTVARRENTS
jgi:beta-carotene 3-hydroxylase